ncbi:MAG: hypothetical protein U0791_10930 [Gemmataceae bacterium]
MAHSDPPKQEKRGWQYTVGLLIAIPWILFGVSIWFSIIVEGTLAQRIGLAIIFLAPIVGGAWHWMNGTTKVPTSSNDGQAQAPLLGDTERSNVVAETTDRATTEPGNSPCQPKDEKNEARTASAIEPSNQSTSRSSLHPFLTRAQRRVLLAGCFCLCGFVIFVPWTDLKGTSAGYHFLFDAPRAARVDFGRAAIPISLVMISTVVAVLLLARSAEERARLESAYEQQTERRRQEKQLRRYEAARRTHGDDTTRSSAVPSTMVSNSSAQEMSRGEPQSSTAPNANRRTISETAWVMIVLGTILLLCSQQVSSAAVVVRCAIWGVSFGLPACFCYRMRSRSGISSIAALYCLAAGLDLAIESYIEEVRDRTAKSRIAEKQETIADKLAFVMDPAGKVRLQPQGELDQIRRTDRPEWKDRTYSRESRVQDYLLTRARQSFTWHQVAADFQRYFEAHPASAEKTFKLEQARIRMSGNPWMELSEARLRPIPYAWALAAWTVCDRYSIATMRFKQGIANDQDIEHIAKYESHLDPEGHFRP